MKMTYEQLLASCRPGGASALTSRTELQPAAGPLAGIAPARYVDTHNNPTFAFETRFDGQNEVAAVVIDSKASALNRIEEALAKRIWDEDPILAKTPRIVVSYEGKRPLTDLELPHRAFDGHIRAGTIDGVPAPKHEAYRAVRNATPANAKPVLETSPFSLIGGAWDSTRRSDQGRYRSVLVGEVIGILADQSAEGRESPRRGAARTDPVAAGVHLSAAEMEKVVSAQEAELSTRNATTIRQEMTKAGAKGTVSGSKLGLGSIPPTMSGLGLVSCRRVVRHHVLSFSALRQLRFGLGVDGDAQARALLAALALDGLARSDAELLLRANCDLVEAGATEVVLDGRQGHNEHLEALQVDEADDLLATAIKHAVAAGVRWEGQTLEVTGNPIISSGMSADEPEDN